jgi:hypothetical protein
MANQSEESGNNFAVLLGVLFFGLPAITLVLVIYMAFWKSGNSENATSAIEALKSEFESNSATAKVLLEQYAKQSKENANLFESLKSTSGNHAVLSKEILSKLDTVALATKAASKEITNRLDDQIKRFEPIPVGGSPTQPASGKPTLVALCLSKSLNISKDETRDLAAKLVSVIPSSKQNDKSLLGQLLVVGDIAGGKKLLVSKDNIRDLETWLGTNTPSESRPAMDGLSKMVTDALGSFGKEIERLVVVTNHEFRFRDAELTDWNRFKSVSFVMLEGPIPDYFEWGHVNKLKEFRKKWQGHETKIRIFKRQLDKGMVLEEMADLASMVAELTKNGM